MYLEIKLAKQKLEQENLNKKIVDTQVLKSSINEISNSSYGK